MKKLSLILSVLLISVSLSAKDNVVNVSNAVVKRSGDNVVVSFQVDAEELKSDYKVTLAPVVYGDNSSNARTLTPLVLVGKKRNISDQRIGDLDGDRRIITKKTQQPVDYTASIPFESWMQYVSVSVDQVWEGCCTENQTPKEVLADNILLYYNVTPHFDKTKLDYGLTELEKYDLENPFLHPMEDYSKRYDILLKDRDKGTSKVIFKVGVSVIDMDFHGNSQVLESISKAFDLIESDPNAILKHIMIAGYASPEGSLALNTRLGLARAEAVKEFLKSRMKNPDESLFELYNGREDWDGLREMVEKSNMAQRQEVLNIIDGYTMEQEERKTKLKQLGGGAPYKYMLENFYPPLRSGGYLQVYYEIDRKATVATAVTDSQGRTTWIDPDSPENRGVTAINRAIDLMVANKFDEALRLLLEFKDDPRAYNNIGVCYMMTGNYTEADRYFERALASGDKFAAANMEETKLAKQVLFK